MNIGGGWRFNYSLQGGMDSQCVSGGGPTGDGGLCLTARHEEVLLYVKMIIYGASGSCLLYTQ